MTDPINTSEATKTLIIDLSEEYKIKIEKPSELKDSFFKDIYKKAAGAVTDIITQTEKKIDGVKDPFLNEQQDYNNIIAFCGERGTGKSSAMISFAQSLLKIDTKEATEFYGNEQEITKRRYETLKVIDPSLFEEDENIFEVILAQLFSSFETVLKGKEKDNDIDQKRKLLEQFEKVYENLQTIKKNGQKYDGEALETLSKLACGANLRENFKELVNRYLKFITKDDEEKKNIYLLVPIDDFDLNVNAVADMAEQIRKYLMIPTVIVLMAANIDLLKEAKEKSLRDSLNGNNYKENKNHDWREATQKYLLKFIPLERRIYLEELHISNVKKIKLVVKNSLTKQTFIEEKYSIEKSLFSLLFKKTGIIFLNEKEKIHHFFPKTLREVCSLVSTLSSFPEDNRNVSLSLFSSYFKNSWINENLTSEYRNIIFELYSQSHHDLNKQVIIRTIDYFAEKVQTKTKTINSDFFYLFKKEDKSSISEISNIINRINFPRNISLGDVLFFFTEVESFNDNVDFRKFVFATKLFYTIELNKILHSNLSQKTRLAQLREIVGTFLINPNVELIQKSKLIEGLAKRDYYEYDYTKVKNKCKSKDSTDLLFYEFIHFFTCNIGSIPPNNYRNKEDFEFTFENSTNKKKAYFNCTSFITNILFKEKLVESCFDDNTLKSLMQSESSIIKQLSNEETVSLLVHPFCNIEFIEKIFNPLVLKKNNLNRNQGFSFFLINYSKKMREQSKLLSEENSNLDLIEFKKIFENNAFFNYLDQMNPQSQLALDQIFFDAFPNHWVPFMESLARELKLGVERYHRFNLNIKELQNVIKVYLKSITRKPTYQNFSELANLARWLEDQLICIRNISDNLMDSPDISKLSGSEIVTQDYKDLVVNQEKEKTFVQDRIEKVLLHFQDLTLSADDE